MAAWPRALGEKPRLHSGRRLFGHLQHAERRNRERGTVGPAATRVLESVARRAVEFFWRDFSDEALALELADERTRDSLGNEKVLLKYLSRWRRRLERLQLARPGPWKVAGLDPEELRDELEVRLLEALRERQGSGDPGPFLAGYEEAGEEATYRFLVRAKDALRNQRRMFLLPRRFRAPPPRTNALEDLFSSMRAPGSDTFSHWLRTAIMERVRSPEELFAAVESQARAKAILNDVVPLLSRLQRGWFDAMKAQLAEREDAQRLNLQGVADTLNRKRSSAVRAKQSIQERLRDVGAGELVDH